MAKQFNVGCGLINRRRNCFVNATLQTLFHIPKISDCLQSEVNGNNCTVRNCLACSVLNLFKNTKSSNVACSPYQLYDTLKKKKGRWTDLLNGEHQDAHEFLLVLNHELQTGVHSARWFSDNFTVNLVTRIKCGSCGKDHDSSSQVEEFALHFKGNRSIQAAIDSYFNYDDVDFLCEDCRTYDTVKKKHFLLSAPACLRLQLRRFTERGTKITDAIEISSVTLKKHFLLSQSSEWNYRLVAVINHFGETRNVGHYNSIVLTPNEEYFEFDDLSVRKVSSNLVSGENVYMLFYEKIEESQNCDSNIEIASSSSNVNLDDERCPTTNIGERLEFGANRFQNSIETDSSIVEENEELAGSQNVLGSGRRIVDIDYFFNQMTQLTDFICRMCESGKLIRTKEIRKGIQSSFIFMCNNCGNSLRFNSCPVHDDSENINTSSILSIVQVGLGYYHLEEFFAHLNVPAMSYVTYHKHEEQIQVEYLKLCKRLEDEALAEEIKLAKEMNEVDSAGNALIAVEFDGSWEKRSYTTNFSSLAGCAAIIGLRTRKILYSATKQKYCHICKIAESKKITPRNHICKRNYDGPSSGMETQIILEGFQYCAEKGARFHKFVGDGDSSTYKAIRDLQIYKDPYIMVEKFECVNHIFRNFFKQFKALLKSPKSSLKGRKLLTLEIGRSICIGIRLAAKHWREASVELTAKYHNLEQDVTNAVHHYLGLHDDCARYFCEKSTSPEALITINILKETGVYYTLMDLCQSYFGNNVKSLVAGLCTNRTEGFNSLIAKSIGGKRICNSLAGSYQMRTNIASVQYNTGGHSGSKIQKQIFGKSSPIIDRMEEKRKRKCCQNAVDKEKRKKNFDEPPAKKTKRRFYADGREELDMTDSNYEVRKTRSMQRLRENQMNRIAIEIETRGHPHSFRWVEVRQLLLTSSYFGRILNVRSRHSYTKIVEEILYNNIQYSNTADMRHQRIYEKEGLKIFAEIYRFESINTCGIFIDEEMSFLGATPLRTYGDNAIVVVKCPRKEFRKSLSNSIKTIPFWTGNFENRGINKKSHWFYEIQGKLHITKRKMAYLVIYLGNEVYEIVELERDDAFWKDEMEKELRYFFNNALLKEMVDSRVDRTMEVRKYNSEKESFEQLNLTLSETQELYNQMLSSTRQVIERPLGYSSDGSVELKFLDMSNAERIPKTIVACCVLHNFCLGEKKYDDFIREGMTVVDSNNEISENENILAYDTTNTLQGE